MIPDSKVPKALFLKDVHGSVYKIELDMWEPGTLRIRESRQIECPDCKGTGRQIEAAGMSSDTVVYHTPKCVTCEGEGRLWT